MAFLTSPEGVRLHYELEGSGPPLVLHLGAGADAELWRAAGYVEPLSKLFTCVLFDHRGHGASDHPTSIAANHIDRYANDVAALVAHLDHPNVAFFGWSNAVLVGLKAAQDHPGLFDRLVLFGAISPPATAEEIRDRVSRRLPLIRERGWRYLLDNMQAAEKLPVPQWFLDRVLATDPEPWLAFTESQPAWNWSPWAAMPLIQAPTLIFAGELEDPEDVMAAAAAAMPDATRVRIPDREHINAFLYSEFVVPQVLEFLGSRTVQATG
jgi:pimeloyl-ACP methyl ester carboxylesterase